MGELQLLDQGEGNGSEVATHFFLYLTSDTFVVPVGEQLASHVRVARAHGLSIVMVHESDIEKGGCAFGRCAIFRLQLIR